MKPFQLAVLPALVLCACVTTHAQKRKPALPMDTVTSEIIMQDLLYRHPPKVENSEEKVFGNPYMQPEYPGGTRALYHFIESNLKIPVQAKKAGVSGRVFITFTIEETGEVTNVTVFKGLGFGCDAEAVRLVKSMPRWKPARVHNKPYRVKYNLPISFITN